jgi:hypothetical protein
MRPTPDPSKSLAFSLGFETPEEEQHKTRISNMLKQPIQEGDGAVIQDSLVREVFEPANGEEKHIFGKVVSAQSTYPAAEIEFHPIDTSGAKLPSLEEMSKHDSTTLPHGTLPRVMMHTRVPRSLTPVERVLEVIQEIRFGGATFPRYTMKSETIPNAIREVSQNFVEQWSDEITAIILPRSDFEATVNHIKQHGALESDFAYPNTLHIHGIPIFVSLDIKVPVAIGEKSWPVVFELAQRDEYA